MRAWRGGPDELVERKDEIGSLTGLRLSSNPDVAWRQFAEKMRRLRREFKEQCVVARDWKYCLYQYKELSAKAYIRSPVLAAMRGTVIKWYSDGGSATAAFPFAKFFNYGETEETEELPDSGFLATEKLDGTLIIVWRDPDTGELHYNTRGMLEQFGVVKGKAKMHIYKGEGIVNPYVKAFLNAVKRHGLGHDLEALAKEGRTLMFELVGKVPASYAAATASVPDPDDESWTPYLIALRNHSDWSVEYAGADFDPRGFPTPETVRASSVRELAEAVREWRNREGVVLYYPGKTYREGMPWWNYLVKLKSFKYALAGVIYVDGKPAWRRIVRSVLTGAHDDVVALADAEVAEFAKEVMRRYGAIREDWLELAEMLRETGEKGRNFLANNARAGWMIPYLEESVKRGESPLKRLIIEKAPKTKDAIIGFMERLHGRIRAALAELRRRKSP